MDANTSKEVKELIEEYLSNKNGMSREQEMFLKENKGLLFEYYEQVSNPRVDAHILGGLEVWVYGDDRQDFTPHCHVMLHDRSVEVEISIIDWSIVNVKNGNFTSKMHKSFLKWLNSENSRLGGIANKMSLYAIWDGNNPNNDITRFVIKHGIDVKDADLKKYMHRQLELVKNSNSKH